MKNSIQYDQKLKKSKQSNYIPPFCPNPKCSCHVDPHPKFWHKTGIRKVKKYPGFVQKYSCKICKKGFSYTSFTLEYRRRSDPFEFVFKCSTSGMSNRSIATILGVSEHKVRECIKVLSRQCLLNQERLIQNKKVENSLVYDGFETFSYSQFDPNNINCLVSKDSLFTWDYSFSHLNRKGRMTDAQKCKLKKIEKKYGRYPSNQIRKKSSFIFKNSFANIDTKLTLNTDEHKIYPLALKDSCSEKKIDHVVTNSKIHRNIHNPLFAVNHLDMLFRHFLKNCTRETIGFSKNEAGLMDRINLFLSCKNFMKTKFVKTKNKEAKKTPAMLAGVVDKIYSFKDFFKVRLSSIQIKLRKHWKELYFRVFEAGRYKIRPYLGD